MRLTFDITRDGVPLIDAANAALGQAQQQVASGKRMQTVADDPTAAASAIGDHTELDAIDSYTSAAGSVASRQAAADTTLSDVINKITAALTTATGAQGSTATQQTRDAAADALAGIRDALLGDANTSYQGTHLFAGTDVGQTPYALVGGVWTYQGNNSGANISIDDGRQVAQTWNGQAIFQGSASTDVFTDLDNLITAVKNGDNTAIGQGIDQLQGAFDRATQAQNRLGSDEQSVQDATSRLQNLRTATDTRRSQDEDTNMADAISRMTQAQTAYRSALSAVAATGQLSLFDYLQ